VEIILRHTTLGRTLLDEKSALRRAKQLTRHKDICTSKKEPSFGVLFQSPSFDHFCEDIGTAETSSMIIWKQLCLTVSVFWRAN
jgi:hypothetical protein